MEKENALKLYNNAEKLYKEEWGNNCNLRGTSERKESSKKLWALGELKKLAYRNLNIIISKNAYK